MLRKLVLATLLLTACASKPKPQPPSVPSWDVIPAGIVGSICARLQSEGISPEGTIYVVGTTSPIATAASIGSLGNQYGSAMSGHAGLTADAIAANLKSIPVQVPEHGCTFEVIDAIHKHEHRDRQLLELSSPFANPWTRGEAGLLARFSVGNENASWYWIPLARRGEQWAVGSVALLDLHE